jgi:transcription antitermination protein NusB
LFHLETGIFLYVETITSPMQASRKKTRKYLFQKLYASIFAPQNEELFYGSFFEGIFDFDLDEEYLKEMFILVREKESFFLGVIMKYAPKFDIESMNKATILSTAIGITEMYFYTGEIPAKVSINEAVELAKVYGDESSKKVVNGILNSFFEEISKEKKANISLVEKIAFFEKV